MSFKNFIISLLGLFLLMLFLPLLANYDGYDFARIFAFSIGLFAGILIWCAIIWSIIRLIKGTNNAPEIKSFLIKFSTIFYVIFFLLQFFGLLRN